MQARVIAVLALLSLAAGVFGYMRLGTGGIAAVAILTILRK